VAAGTLKFCENRPLAGQFVDFMAGPEGKAILVKHGYTVEEPK
jgi:ABC-type molybdate transport system substrate-binding protein